MRAIVTCESCRHRQWLVRGIDRVESFHVICERCERVLQVAVTEAHLAAARSPEPGVRPAAERPAVPQGDAGIGWHAAGGAIGPLV